MQSNQRIRKTSSFFVAFLFLLCSHAFSQSWSITGNANIAAGTNYLGTKDPNDLVFRTNAIERGRVLGNGGNWRFGTAPNFAKIDSLGKLSFTGTGTYLVGGNRYVFQYTANNNYGLFFNSTVPQYEFRNGSAAPVFFVNANTGAGTFKSTLKIGAYTLPATDGTSGEVLKTNGSGTVSWGSVNTNFWSLTGNAGTNPNINFIGTTDSKGFSIRTNNVDRIRVGFDGHIGIGTTTPKAQLQINGGTYATLTTPGYLQLGDSVDYNMGMDNTAIQARQNGAPSVLFLNDNGGVTQVGNSSTSYQGILAAGNTFGVYAYAPTDTGTGVYGLGGKYGGYFENFNGIGVYGKNDGTFGHGVYGYETGSGEGVDGYAYGAAGYGVFGLSDQSYGVYGKTNNPSSYAGFFNGNVFTTGTYTPSDQKLKENVQDFTSAMSVINQLHPKQYQYRQDGSYKLMNLPQGLHYGLIAQEVEKIMPGLVKDTKFDVDKTIHLSEKPLDPKNPTAQTKTAASKKEEAINFEAINYTELIPILIKGMQEQQQTINNQQKQIDDLKAMVLSLTQGKVVTFAETESNALVNNITLSGASLEQNIPNPLNNTTSIHYNVPAGNASLLITDIKGKSVKAVTLQTGTGTVNIDASTLSAGAYSYSLIIDGKTIATRKMVVVH